MINSIFHRTIWRAAFILSCFFFSACENNQKTIDDLTKNVRTPEVGVNIETYLSQNGHMRAKLWAPYMLRFPTDTIYVEFPRQLHVNFFDTLGKTESHLDALYGKYFETLNKVYLRDSVIVFNVQGDTLQTPELWWDQNAGRFYTEKKVRVRRMGNVIYGVGMDARQDLTDIHIRQITNSTIQVPDSLQ